ncbi:MAG: hypothetical protein M3Q93_09415 [Gemmatimonadota bacterium]|nr:hypothetical protein [Gemmatimonadota bacterium]
MIVAIDKVDHQLRPAGDLPMNRRRASWNRSRCHRRTPRSLSPGGRGLTAEQSAVLAHHVAHALMVAASSTGGVEPAVGYLKQVASEH